MSPVAQYTYTDTFGYETRKPRSKLPSHLNLHCLPKTLPYIYRLPVEMLARIFEMGTHGSDDINDAVDFPVQVASVSRHFRAVACATPSLWATINFHTPRPSWYDPDSNDEYEYTYTRDRIWLERSRACPLELILCFRDMSWNFNENKHYFQPEHMERIISLVAPHARRVRRLTIICDTYAPLHVALRFLAAHGSLMERLETLELYRCNEFPAEQPVFYPWNLAGPIPLLGGSFAPKLTKVVLSGVHVDWNLSKAPLSNLENLELAYHSRQVRPSTPDFVDILRGSPNLTSLIVVDSGPTSPLTDLQSLQNGECSISSNDPIHRVCLPLLKTFKIGYSRAADAFSLLHLIDAPLTMDLTIKDTSRPSEDDTDGGSSILATIGNPYTKLFPQVKVLSLDAVKTTAQAFATCLESCSGIHTLNLDHVSREVLFVIAPPHSYPQSNPACPSLKKLSLRLMPGLGAGTIAKARDAAGMALDALSINFKDGISDEELALAKAHSKVVTLFGQPLEDGDDGLMDWGENDDPYAPGGAFNDPDFDAMFT